MYAKRPNGFAPAWRKAGPQDRRCDQRSRMESAGSSVLPATPPRQAASRGSARCNMPERVATTTEATMTKSTGKSSSAIDAAETKVTTAKRAVSMAAEKRPPRLR